MVSLPSTRQQRRDRLFFNAYRYRAQTTVPSASRIRYCRTAEQLHEYLAELHTRFSGNSGLVRDLVLPDDQQFNQLVSLLEFRNRSPDCLMRLELSKVAVYSNNLEALHMFHLMFDSEITEAVTTSTDAGVIYRKSPTSAFRTYLRSRGLTDSEQEDLKQWFSRQASVRASEALQRWLDDSALRSWYNRKNLRTDYYFEHDSLPILTAFNLCFSNLLGKTVEVRSAA